MTAERLVKVWGQRDANPKGGGVESMTSTRRDRHLHVPTLDDFWIEASLSASIESATPEQQSWLVTVEQESPFGSVDGCSDRTSTDVFRPLDIENEEDIFYDAEESYSDLDNAMMNAADLVENGQHAGIFERKQWPHTLLWRILGWVKQASGYVNDKSENDNYDKSSIQTPPAVLRVSKSRSISSPLSSCRSARSLQASFDLAAESPERFLLSFSNVTRFPSFLVPYRSKE